jgi:LysR family transcriptional activator of mexEF-oprN operon
MVGKSRNVRCSISSFAHLGGLIEGTAMLATIPELVARQIRTSHPRLRTKPVPFPIPGSSSELLWPIAKSDDEPGRFVREQILAIAKALPA